MTAAYLTDSARETQELGRRLAQEILKNKQDKPARSAGGAFVLALEGDLGGGKTTFLQGFAKGLGIKEKILSPTFVILKRFKIKSRHLDISTYHSFYHIDCYRIQNPKEILALGFKEIVANPQNIITIEWAEKIKGILPKGTPWLKFEIKGSNKRKIVVN